MLPSASKQPRFRRRWIEALLREIFHPNRSEFWHAVCSRHFTDGEPSDAHPVLTLFGYNNYGKSQGKPRTSNNSRASVSKRSLKGLHLFSVVMIRLNKDRLFFNIHA